MEGIVGRSFSVNLTVMRLFGFYLPENHIDLYKVKGYMMYLLFIIPVPSLGCLYLILEDTDLAQVAQNAFLLAEMGCYFTKFLPFLSNGRQIKRCIHFFEAPRFGEFNAGHQEVIDDCSRECRRISVVFLGSVIVGYIPWAIRPFFLQHRRLPIDIWLPFNPTSDVRVYSSVYLFLAVVAYAAMSSGVIDPLIAGLACQATGQLKILKDNLQRLSECPEDDFSERFTIIYDKIKLYIDHHDEILTFVKEYEQCFSLVVFSQFMGSVIVICVSCLQLSMMEPFTFNFFAMVLFIIPMLAEIYLYCHYGTTLFEESNTLTDAIYMGEWYEYDVKSRKALIILMERSKKPMIVTAGKILDLSLVTFTMILRRSYSLLAVLKNYK